LCVCFCPAHTMRASWLALATALGAPVFPSVVSFDDVVGHAGVKQALQKGHLAGARQVSPRADAVLLHGVGGVGKSVLAQALAFHLRAAVIRVLAPAATGAEILEACREAAEHSKSQERAVALVVEQLDTAPDAAGALSRCYFELSEPLSAEGSAGAARVVVIGTAARETAVLQSLFGQSLRVDRPSAADRAAYLKRLVAGYSVRAQGGGSSLDDGVAAGVAAKAAEFTYSDLEVLAQRALAAAGSGTTALTEAHFDRTLESMRPTQVYVTPVVAASPEQGVAADQPAAGGNSTAGKKKDGLEFLEIFGVLNKILPESMQMPPIVWAMILFGILTHFMTAATSPRRKKRGSAGKPSLFSTPGARGGMRGGPGMFGANEDLGDLMAGAGMPMPPGGFGMPGPPGAGAEGPAGAPTNSPPE